MFGHGFDKLVLGLYFFLTHLQEKAKLLLYSTTNSGAQTPTYVEFLPSFTHCRWMNMKRFCICSLLIPPKRFDIFSPITGGCSEGLGVL